MFRSIVTQFRKPISLKSTSLQQLIRTIRTIPDDGKTLQSFVQNSLPDQQTNTTQQHEHIQPLGK
jgi:hypothetical protein